MNGSSIPALPGDASPGEGDADELAHLANVLGAVAVGVSDTQAEALRAATGLDLSAAGALTTLLDHPGIPIEALARVLGLTHSGTVRLADRLAERALLARVPGADRRTAPLRLTREGEQLARLALEARQQTLRRLLAPITADQQAHLLALAQTVAGALVGNRAQARRICRHCEHACCRGPSCPIGSAAHDP